MLAEYHRRFRYILVDEYQDTNAAQYLWLRLLAQRPRRASLPLDGERCRQAERGSANRPTQARPLVRPSDDLPP